MVKSLSLIGCLGQLALEFSSESQGLGNPPGPSCGEVIVNVAVPRCRLSHKKTAIAHQGDEARSREEVWIHPSTGHGSRLLLFTVALLSGIQRS